MSLVGATNTAYQIELSPGATMIAAGFLPEGWMRLVRCSALELADEVIDGSDIWGFSKSQLLCDQLWSENLDGTHIRFVEQFLSATVHTHRYQSLISAVDTWLEYSSDLNVDTLSWNLGSDVVNSRE